MDFSIDALPILWSPDGKWVLLFHDDMYYLWELVSQVKLEFLVTSESDYLYPVGWSPNSRYLYMRDSNLITAIDTTGLAAKPIVILDLTDSGIPIGPFSLIAVWVSSIESSQP